MSLKYESEANLRTQYKQKTDALNSGCREFWGSIFKSAVVLSLKFIVLRPDFYMDLHFECQSNNYYYYDAATISEMANNH